MQRQIKHILLSFLTVFILILECSMADAKNITTQYTDSHEQCKTVIAGAKYLLEAEGASCQILNSFTKSWIDIKCQKANKVKFLKCDNAIFKIDEYVD